MLIATVAARRHDGGEFIEIKFDDGLQGGAVAVSRRLSGRAS